MIVCSCHGLNEATVRQAVRAGAHSTPQLGRACGAGGDCGSCQPLLEAILKGELEEFAAPMRATRTLSHPDPAENRCRATRRSPRPSTSV